MRYFSPAGDILTFKTSLHCVMHSEPSASTFHRRNKPTYTKISITRRFCRKLCDISFPYRIFRRLNALCTALCVLNVVHACPPASKQAQMFANCNNSSISSKIKRYFLPFEIFRRLNALFTALCVQNVVRVLYVVETSPDSGKTLSFVDFDENYAIFLSRSRYCDV